MKFWRTLQADLKISIFSLRTLVAITAIFAFCCISVYKYINFDFLDKTNALYFLDLLIGLSMFKKVLVILAGIPFVAGFCNDWNSQYIRFAVSRSGLWCYIASKVIACITSSFLASLLGILLFVGALSTIMPLYDPAFTNLDGSVFGALATNGNLVACGLLVAVGFAIGTSFWVMCGFALSAYLPNRYIALLSPFVFCYLLEEIFRNTSTWGSIYWLSRVGAPFLDLGLLPNMAYFMLYFGILFSICALVFFHQVSRRVKNESV